MSEPTVAQDSFIDEQFAPLDTRTGAGSFRDNLDQLVKENPEFAPQPEAEEIEPEPEPAAESPETPEPEVTELEDGSVLVIERTAKKGWKATLDPQDGSNPEIFYGNTQMELLQRVATGKLNATKQIRKLNRQIKIGTVAERPAPPEPTIVPQIRELTADEKFQVATALKDNPDLALQDWFQKRTGMKVEDLVKLAAQGQQAAAALAAETVAREFMAENPDYYPAHTNFLALVGYLSKVRLNRPMALSEADTTVGRLYEAGFWTVRDLMEAYEELDGAGLLESVPATSEEISEEVEPEVVQPAAAAPAAPSEDERIVRTVRRPRAGLGLRSRDASAPAAVTEKPPSDEDLNNLSDAEIAKLYEGVRRSRIQNRR